MKRRKVWITRDGNGRFYCRAWSDKYNAIVDLCLGHDTKTAALACAKEIRAEDKRARS